MTHVSPKLAIKLYSRLIRTRRFYQIQRHNTSVFGVQGSSIPRPSSLNTKSAAWQTSSALTTARTTEVILEEPEYFVHFPPSSYPFPSEVQSGPLLSQQHDDLSSLNFHTPPPSNYTTTATARPQSLTAVEVVSSPACLSSCREIQPQGGCVDDPSRLMIEKGVCMMGTDAAYTDGSIKHLGKQLDRFKKKHLFLGQFEMLGRSGRRKGGVIFSFIIFQ